MIKKVQNRKNTQMNVRCHNQFGGTFFEMVILILCVSIVVVTSVSQVGSILSTKLTQASEDAIGGGQGGCGQGGCSSGGSDGTLYGN